MKEPSAIAGTVLGYVALQGDYVDDITCDPTWMGRGVGRALLAAAATVVLRNEASPVMYLDVRAENSPAVGLYKSLGFDMTLDFPGFLDWHGGLSCQAQTAAVMGALDSSIDISGLMRPL